MPEILGCLTLSPVFSQLASQLSIYSIHLSKFLFGLYFASFTIHWLAGWLAGWIATSLSIFLAPFGFLKAVCLCRSQPLN
ncbi:hypothetical protein NC653_004696 [Populus alba x Populus x berolinensis]|uniref:Uncharacterized protein n=1 Tax=Populus alba x Populus x berolinensis TaxID=444605 RepID=A0AAD6RUM3_9ROSI|nr:hypothetical protein NC653_004696 [Populus alba x Populus x berolinensis]